jgi:hypothetical protein
MTLDWRRLLEATRSLTRRVGSLSAGEACPGCRNSSGTASPSVSGALPLLSPARRGTFSPLSCHHCSCSSLCSLITTPVRHRAGSYDVRPGLPLSARQTDSSTAYTVSLVRALQHGNPNTGHWARESAQVQLGLPVFPQAQPTLTPGTFILMCVIKCLCMQGGASGGRMLYFAAGGVLGGALVGVAG